jgi:hypothetical protein
MLIRLLFLVYLLCHCLAYLHSCVVSDGEASFRVQSFQLEARLSELIELETIEG